MYDFDPERLAKVEALRAEGFPPWPSSRVAPTSSEAIRKLAEGKADEDLAALGSFPFAGRLLFKNEMGKAGFGRVQDADGRLQIYIRKNDVSEEAFLLWKRLDLGDIVGATGSLMRTKTGELSLKLTSLELLSKCMSSLPDKFHGLSDPEARQRQRYVDLFMNPETREVFLKRSRIVSQIRRFFEDRGFVEVETPMMQPIPGGAAARPFITHHNTLDMPLYLRIAPELYLKRLVVGGMEKVFEINRNFRNEGMDTTHNPEFTMLEFYQAHTTWEHLMDLTEELVTGLVETLTGGTTIVYQGTTLDFSRPWRRVAMGDLIAEATGLTRTEVDDPALLRDRWLRAHPGANAEAKLPSSRGQWWEWFFDAYVEKTLQNPTFMTAFPVEISPLSRRNDIDTTVADRFELFVAGKELANGFNELNDPMDQAERFAAQAKARTAGDAEAMFFDHDYVTALTYGLPPTAGEGLGIDRLVMFLTDSASIRDVILFPLLRPRAAEKEAGKTA